MPTIDTDGHVFQFKIYLLGISPQVWRRVLIHPDSSLRDLHGVIQAVFGWEGYHLHQFLLHGTWFGDGPASCGDERRPLNSFRLRARERFQYEYDFTDRWLHEIRLEKLVPVRPKSLAPFCVAGSGQTPPEDCGGPSRYLEERGFLMNWLYKFDKRTANEELALLAGQATG